MKPLWSGTIGFGLINIPINLYSGSKDRTFHFEMLHKKDLSPIRFAKICKKEEKEISYEEIVKGYEYQKGKYVVIQDKDFDKTLSANTKYIEIQCFIDEKEVDSIYFNKPYFLEPEKEAQKAYWLLHKTLISTKKVGVVVYTLHSMQHIGLIRPYKNFLIIEQLRYKTEIKDASEIQVSKTKIQKKELQVAIKLVEQMSERFHIEKFKDIHTETLKNIIAYKTKKKKFPRIKKSLTKRTSKSLLFQTLQKSLKNDLYHSHMLMKKSKNSNKHQRH